jgi:hypothetical protein
LLLDLTEDERHALVQLVRRTIEDDPYPLSPRPVGCTTRGTTGRAMGHTLAAIIRIGAPQPIVEQDRIVGAKPFAPDSRLSRRATRIRRPLRGQFTVHPAARRFAPQFELASRPGGDRFENLLELWRGTLCSIGSAEHYLFTTGYVPYWDQYSGPHVPAPLQIGSAGDTDMRERAREILALKGGQ